ncbi:MAG: hypothetical protein H0T80_19300 [Betaproteobacteria bacterium]|nr:hypothetical protein [Betaproteobacteria bacterium]
MSFLACVLILAVGVLIGAIGIAGFLVVPILVFVEGASVRDAVIVAAVSFLSVRVSCRWRRGCIAGDSRPVAIACSWWRLFRARYWARCCSGS